MSADDHFYITAQPPLPQDKHKQVSSSSLNHHAYDSRIISRRGWACRRTQKACALSGYRGGLFWELWKPGASFIEADDNGCIYKFGIEASHSVTWLMQWLAGCWNASEAWKSPVNAFKCECSDVSVISEVRRGYGTETFRVVNVYRYTVFTYILQH